MCQKPKLLTEYIDFLRDQQCLSKETITLRERLVTSFLLYLGDAAQPSTLSKLPAKIIHDYIITTAQPLHRVSKKHLTSSIRSFLKFAHIMGYLERDLREAVPMIPTRKLDRLPQSISWEDTQKLLVMPDKDTPIGRRDFAILSLLIHYGVRIRQVTLLKLSDIHWREGVIFFTGIKHSNSLRLPLHKEVADALLTYIKKDRKNPQFQEVFLTMKGIPRPLSGNNHFHRNLKKYYVKASISSSSTGSRIIRHSFATQLVNEKIPIKTISDLLGHRVIETTFIYTKVNVVQLRELSRDWPEGV